MNYSRLTFAYKIYKKIFGSNILFNLEHRINHFFACVVRFSDNWDGTKFPRSVKIPQMRGAGVTSKAGFQTGQFSGQVLIPEICSFR